MSDSSVSNNIEINRDQLPNHVAVIMDGNGRWAKNRNLIRTNGHTEGLKRAKEIAKAASDLGLKFITFYVFSTENWKRTKEEVGFLMNLIHTYLLSEFAFCKENGIAFFYIPIIIKWAINRDNILLS